MSLDVTLSCGSVSAHYSQIYTGFHLLELQGVVRLSFRCEGTGLGAIADGRRLFFDVQDGGELDEAELSRSHLYLKRSYCADVVRNSPHGHKVRPLGLNYEVYPDGPQLRAAWPHLRLGSNLKRKGSGLLRTLGCQPGFVPRLRSMEASPGTGGEPAVLFLTRTWAPNGTRHVGIAPREELNEFRADCIRVLRREFGSRAIAGFAPTPHAAQNYPDLIAPCPTDHASYLALLRRVPIGVATTGLHGSVGWKLGEYVAFSRAIVSEKVDVVVPGFQAGRNYLEFASPGECLEKIGTLFEDRTRLRAMMHDNARYYAQYLRPDRLVGRALTAAVTCKRAA